jgi:hypothetical protein
MLLQFSLTISFVSNASLTFQEQDLTLQIHMETE